MANSQIKLYHFYRRYRWTAEDFLGWQTGMVDLARGMFEGLTGASVLKGFECSASGLQVTVASGIAAGPSGFLNVVTSVNVLTMTAPSTNPVRNLIVARPNLVDGDYISSPTSPFSSVPLTQQQNSQIVVVSGTQSTTPSYPAVQPNDVILVGVRLQAGQSSIAASDLDFEVRDIPGKNSNFQQNFGKYDDRLRPYVSSVGVLGIKPSQLEPPLARQFSYTKGTRISIFPKASGGTYNPLDTLVNFSTGTITGGDEVSADFSPTIPSAGNAINATVSIGTNDTLSISYGTQGTRAQCLTGIKDQVTTGAGSVNLPTESKFVAFVTIFSVNGSAVTEMNFFDCRGYSGVGLFNPGISPWDSLISYSIGNFVSDGVDKIYVSLVNSNLNNAVTDVTKWKLYGDDVFTTVTVNTAMTPGKAYIPNSASLILFTLPATAAVGDRFKIYGKGSGGWKLAVNSGQTVYFGNLSQIFTISSALKSKYANDCVEIVCITANTTFNVVDFAGSPAIEGNYWGSRVDGSLTVSTDTNLASTSDGDVIVKNYTQLTIDATKTLTVSNRCKGLWIYVDGDCTINGTLTMTARGASANPTGTPAGGIRFARLKSGSTDTLAASDLGTDVGTALTTAEANQAPVSANGKIYTIVKVGGAGGAGGSANGGTISNGTGGGASGGSPGIVPAGNGAAGTCFSGGAAGGGSSYDPAGTGGTGNSNGGAGGAGGSTSNPSTDAGGGGAGNNGGPGGSGSGGSGSPGGNGSGGLLLLMVRGNLTIGAAGVISANGANGGSGGSGGASPDGGGGGGSGGGRVLVVYGGSLSNAGTIQANGGGQGGGSPSGGAGGAGAVTSPELITV